MSNMYIQVYYPARDTDAIRILEEYLNRYPDSDYLDRRFSLFSNGLPVVKNRLVSLYSKEGEHEKMIRLFEEEIPDISNTPDSLVDYLLDYARSLEMVGRREEAITVYQMYILHEKGEMKDHARRNIIELGGELLESDTAGMVKEAARIGDISELDRLLKTGITPDTELLHIAVRSSQIPTVRYLLEEGVDPDGGIICWTQQSFRSLGSTPLYLAVQEKQPDMVQLLLDYGANSSLYGEGASSRLLIPLELAIESREYEIMEMLLDNGAECYSRFFSTSIENKDAKAFSILLSHNQDLPKGLIHQAVNHRDIDIAGLLLDAGVDINEEYEYYYHGMITPLDLAVKQGDLEMVSFLIRNGAEITETTRNIADDVKYSEMIEYLGTFN